ncbi:MAG: penicillin-binding transpeptidase domain-containing protein, partial [Bdellovibrionota bacterium]
EIDGQVNGTLAKRSPGSALKPFTYALALDQGLVHPMSLLKDTPMSFGAFDPENFDKGFEGPIHVREALTSSRNVPAVFLASRLKELSLFDFLKTAGVALPKTEKHYGLALTLGGAEVTMEELAGLYAGLANKGAFKPLRHFRDAEIPEGKRLMSPEAAFLTLDMLRTNARNNEKHLDSWARDSVPVAWKTGTSYGFRDAWTAGVVGNYVIVVWLGNFEGQSNPALIGRDLAAPLFFQIADGLRREGDKEPSWLDTRELNLKKVEVCSLSGHLPGDHCKHRAKTWFIPAKSPIAKCEIHREIRIAANGMRACDDSRRDVVKHVFEFWPSDLLQLFRQAGIPRRSPPAYEPGCRTSEATTGLAPQITSPRQAVSYSLRVDGEREPASREGVPLAATADADVRTLHWFVGNEYVGESSPQKTIMWKPRPGRHVVRVLDDLGRSDSRSLEVEITR